jgi:hypothetical protein
MARRLNAALLFLLAAAALLAGCGSSSSSSGSSGSSAATSSTPSTGSTSSSQTGSTASTPTSTSSNPAGGASAVASCKRGIQSLPHLQQSTKERLETICEKAASGDVEAKRKAAEEACRELVNASPLPAGEAKERALSACKHAGGTSGK